MKTIDAGDGYEIVPHLVRGLGKPVKRHYVRYKGACVSNEWLNVRSARRFIQKHKADRATDKRMEGD